jgi:hypothetical protein
MPKIFGADVRNALLDYPSVNTQLNFGVSSADSTLVKTISLLLLVLFVAMLAPETAEARKKPSVMRPASKPPVYKKYDNRKSKQPQVKWGNAKR